MSFKLGRRVRKLLRDTLNVKLRYAEIIKKMLDNEKKGGSLTVDEIIESTPRPQVSVEICPTTNLIVVLPNAN